MKPRFLLDEHLKRAIQEQLPEIHIRRIGDKGAPPVATSDPDLLTWIQHNNYILLTNNRTTMPRHLIEHLQAGGHVPGILCFSQRVSIGTYIRELRRIWNSFNPEQYRDVILYLPQRQR